MDRDKGHYVLISEFVLILYFCGVDLLQEKGP